MHRTENSLIRKLPTYFSFTVYTNSVTQYVKVLKFDERKLHRHHASDGRSQRFMDAAWRCCTKVEHQGRQMCCIAILQSFLLHYWEGELFNRFCRRNPWMLNPCLFPLSENDVLFSSSIYHRYIHSSPYDCKW